VLGLSMPRSFAAQRWASGAAGSRQLQALVRLVPLYLTPGQSDKII
jgi:hypothetical protein